MRDRRGDPRYGRDARDARADARDGIPDGLLVGLLAFLLGLTLLVWTATGLAGLFSHGAWPTGVSFANTPLAMRSLAAAPHDLPSAWPETPDAQLSGYGLFWGLAIGELMVLVVLTIFVLGTVARWRAVRAGRVDRKRDVDTGGGAGVADANPLAGQGLGHGLGPGLTGPGNGGSASAAAPNALAQQGPGPGAGPSGTGGAASPYGAGTPTGGGTASPYADATGTGNWPTAISSAAASPHTGTAGPNSLAQQGAGNVEAAPAGAAGPQALAEQGSGGQDPHTTNTGAPGPNPPQGPTPWAHPVPPPRTPRLLFGDPATRRPAALQAVLDAAGPALVVTSDPTVWAETKDARAKLGPVLVYDPGHLCDTPARLHWSPTARCEDAGTAQQRAAALLAPVRPRALLDAAMADTAETLLRCWLHAAAVDGRPFKQVHRWAQGGSAQEAVRILRTHAKATAGLAGLLESALTGHPERREIAQQLVVRALSALSSIHIREACTPNRTDSLTLESFIDEGGTLYLMGEPIEDPRAHPGAMPLLTALASDVVEHGRRMAARSSDGRLDPPMTLVLDDVAAVAPLPSLPELLSSGQNQGLPTLVLLRSAEQARARWPEPLTQ
ncbi:type IV secretory system conjugative DNA transfer family protein [Streptomyces sp. NPDC020681]|uniref:type IV secretory system conjugative DNA transfer family protein n=1 Tax=Streptomyces sp. NPDC020681 TaxID=3365083 RepID=UPI0037AE77B0